jgi:hypothetical protein
MARTLFLGKQYDPESGALGAKVELASSDLVTHGLIVGMTGSGKTGLAVVMIEELLRQGVPVLAIDPKGDLGNLLLLFEDQSAASYAPWIDAGEASRAGLTLEAAAAQAAATWKAGLAEWGLSGSDVGELLRAREAVVYTPGSSAGRRLNLLQSLAAPEGDFEAAEEDLRDEIAGIATSVLGLLDIDADPLRSREFLLLTNLIEHAWRERRDLTLESLIGEVANPPFEKLGALPLDSVYPAKDRQALALGLNNLLASPSFENWREGDPLDVQSLLYSASGKPRLSIVYTAHLPEEQRLFVTALLLDKVKTWTRRQKGTSELRALVYMDEIFGYFPPHPANPPTKRPLLSLLKQARAQGVGVVLATQNPVDLDYKGLANIGVWLVGKLQTEQDRERLRAGLLGVGADAKTLDRLLGATRKRVFLLHDVHRSGLALLHSRFTLSYLRGPLTREEIARLPQQAQAGAPQRATAAPAAAAPPMLPAPFRHHYYSKYGGELAEAHLFVKYAVRYKDAGENVGVRAYPLDAPTAAELLEAEPFEIDEAALGSQAPDNVRFAELPGLLASAGAKGIEKALRERLPDKLELRQFYDPDAKAASRPGEDRQAFATRLGMAGGGKRGEQLAEQIEKKRRVLAVREQEEKGRETEKWAALGSAAISVLGGMFGGRKSALSKAVTGVQKAGGVLSKNRMETNAEARVEQLKEELASLEAELQALAAVDPKRFEERTLTPARGGVKILRYDVVWVW